MSKASRYSFFNTSTKNFDKLLADPDNIEDNFRAYLNGFSDNMQDILDKFKFDNEITEMANNDALYSVIQEFNMKDSCLGADKVTSTEMGYVLKN